MKKEACFLWGRIIRVHGFAGALQLALEGGGLKKNKKPEAVFLEISDSLIPYFVEKLQLTGNTAIIKLEGVDSDAEAKKLQGQHVYLELSHQPAGKGLSGLDGLIGFMVIDKAAGPLGEIISIEEYPQQLIANILFKGKAVMFPLNEMTVKSIGKKSKTLEVELPEGLLDVYL